MSERIYHVATASDWRAARRSGSYETSTLGRTLAEEGFIHASRREQVAGVLERYYSGAGEPLVLLVIDPERLDSPVRVEQVGPETYPHVYGPIATRAVVSTVPLRADGSSEAVFTLFLREMMGRMLGALLVFTLMAGGAALGASFGDAGTRLMGLCAGGALGIGVVLLWKRVR